MRIEAIARPIRGGDRDPTMALCSVCENIDIRSLLLESFTPEYMYEDEFDREWYRDGKLDFMRHHDDISKVGDSANRGCGSVI